MTDLFALLACPGLALGLAAGAAGAYFLGVRDPFLLGASAVAVGILGLALDVPLSRRIRRRTKRG